MLDRAAAPDAAAAAEPSDTALAERWASERDNLRAAMEWAISEGDTSSTVMALSVASSSSWYLAGLMRVLLDRGDIAEAQRAAREALPRLRRAGAFLGCTPAFAWLMACLGDGAAAAQLLGAADAHGLRSGQPLEARAQRCRAGALALLQAAHGPESLRQWQAQGAAVDEAALAALIDPAAAATDSAGRGR